MRIKQDQFVEGGIYHIYNHAIGDELLFRENDDYIWFLKKFKLKHEKYSSSIFAYCLMPNHFHFLLRQDSESPIFMIFNDVNNAYVPHYNHKYKRNGTLYQSPLQHVIVTNEQYLLYLCQYIHCNPVKAGLVNTPEDWEFSNYHEWIGERNEALFNDEILKQNYLNIVDYQNSIHSYEEKLEDKKFSDLLLD